MIFPPATMPCATGYGPTHEIHTTQDHGQRNSRVSKKQRGRPRVEPKDQTAADRRRTQIRLAQRAYRQRKETTITALTRRATELTNIIDQMDASFARLNEDLRQSRIIDPDIRLRSRLDDMVSNYARLVQEAKTATEDNSNESEDVVSGGEGGGPPDVRTFPTLQEPPQPYTQHAFVTRSTVDQKLQPFEPEVAVVMPCEQHDIGGYRGKIEEMDVPVTDMFEQHEDSNLLPPSTDKDNTVAMPLLALKDLPTWGGPLVRQPQHSYSFPGGYATFARRLGLTVLERAFYLSCMTHVRPMAAQHKFHFLLSILSPIELQGKFSRMLAQTANTGPLEVDVPSIALGGAGSHYLRRDAFGNMTVSPNTCTVFPYNGKMVARATNLTDAEFSQEIVVDITGYEGEWLDASDVEGYLREKGVEIDSNAAYVEGEVLGRVTSVHEPGFPLMINPVWCGPQTPPLDLYASSTTTDVPYLSSSSGSSSGRSSADHANSPPHSTSKWVFDGPSIVTGPEHMSYQPVPIAAHQQKVNINKRTQVSVDVAKFIEGLIHGAICLGAAPAFRRHDVDTAFKAAMAVV